MIENIATSFCFEVKKKSFNSIQPPFLYFSLIGERKTNELFSYFSFIYRKKYRLKGQRIKIRFIFC